MSSKIPDASSADTEVNDIRLIMREHKPSTTQVKTVDSHASVTPIAMRKDEAWELSRFRVHTIAPIVTGSKVEA